MMYTKDKMDIFNKQMEKLNSPDFMEWLKEKGFFVSPASTKYHGNYEGGLFDHSFEVAQQLVRLTNALNLKWQRPESPFIVGMFHDLCKIDNYVYVIPNFQGEWTHREDCILKGHGDKSIMLLSQFMTLTEEEILCIRFHMGAYETESWNEYDKAIRKYETVLWTHTADMLASKVAGV